MTKPKTYPPVLKFGQFTPDSSQTKKGSEYHRFLFDNTFGASVVRHPGSYGSQDGLFELAVLRGGNLNYQNPVTNDVRGYLTVDEVAELLTAIEAIDPTLVCWQERYEDIFYAVVDRNGVTALYMYEIGSDTVRVEYQPTGDHPGKHFEMRLSALGVKTIETWQKWMENLYPREPKAISAG